MQFKPTAKAKMLPEEFMNKILDVSYNGVLIHDAPGAEMPPLAWDAYFTIEKGMYRKKEIDLLIIEGGVGSNGFGSVTIKLPLAAAHDVYWFEVEERDAEAAELIEDIFLSHGWEVVA